MLLTAKLVAALQLPPGKAEAIHFDAKLPGFGYRLRRSGGEIKRSWVVQYRRAGGTRRIKLGDAAVLSAEQARKHAMKVLGRVADGEDPQAERHDRRSKDKLTTRAVIEEYVAAKEPELRPRSFVEVKRYLLTGGYFRALHPLPIDTVTRRDIAARLVAITRESSSNTAAHARSVLNGFFVWAMRMGYLEANPVLGTLKPKESVGRSRVLSDAELAAVWRACGDDDHGCIVRLLILTACRRQEIGGLRWSELDEPRGIWTLPGTRSKNRRAHTRRWRRPPGRSSAPCRAWRIVIISSACAPIVVFATGTPPSAHWTRNLATASRGSCCTTFAAPSRPGWPISACSRM
jgi:hypothetical protein